MSRKYIFVINPGSTSTKLGVYEGINCVFVENLEHDVEKLKMYETTIEQYEYRLEVLIEWLRSKSVTKDMMLAVVGRGGLLRPIPGGVYKVTDKMKEDLRNEVQGIHPSNLGGLLASGVADSAGVEAYIVDAIATDEFEPLARITGIKEIPKKALNHALNIKAVSRRRSAELGQPLEKFNFVVAHLGGGISVASVKQGRIVDATIANDFGPFSANRAGSLPAVDLLELCFSGEYTERQAINKILKTGGLVSYLNSTDVKTLLSEAEHDPYKKSVIDAMLYQVVKEIGSYATILNGKVDDIILTGGLAHSDYIVGLIKSSVSYISNIVVYPGEDEMDSLNKGALRAVSGEEKVKIYEEEILTK